ncbi:MAG: hypothetical protein ACP5NW_00960 [Candidatus Woesearchaeota archaeon]
MDIGGHLVSIKNDVKYIISRPKKALATALVVAGMTVGSSGIVKAQESSNTRPDISLNIGSKHTIYQEALPDNQETMINFNGKEVYDELHRKFIPYPSFSSFVREYKMDMAKPNMTTLYSIDSKGLEYLINSSYPKAGESDPCGCSQKVAEVLSEFLNNEEVMSTENSTGEYVVGLLTSKEKNILSKLINQYGHTDFLIPILQIDEPFRIISQDGRETFYAAAQESRGVLHIGSLGDVYLGNGCQNTKVPRQNTAWKVSLFIGPNLIISPNIENYILKDIVCEPSKIDNYTKYPELISGGIAGIKAGPIILGASINGKNYAITDFESYPSVNSCGYTFGRTDVTKNINSQYRIYGANLGVIVLDGLTANVAIYSNSINSKITGYAQQYVTDPLGNSRKHNRTELDPENISDNFLSGSIGLGYNGDRTGINAGAIIKGNKIDGGYVNLVLYLIR